MLMPWHTGKDEREAQLVRRQDFTAALGEFVASAMAWLGLRTRVVRDSERAAPGGLAKKRLDIEPHGILRSRL